MQMACRVAVTGSSRRSNWTLNEVVERTAEEPLTRSMGSKSRLPSPLSPVAARMRWTVTGGRPSGS